MALRPLVAIVGPTGSGKTTLAIDLARQFDGEIICADSRTVYKGMDIGTAKPTVAERKIVPHHLLDVVEPSEPFTVADFKRLSEATIADIHRRGKLPLLVGGSGLYIDSVLYDYQFAAATAPRDLQNPRHLKADTPKQKQTLRANTLILGLAVERDALKERLSVRVEAMLHRGVIDEARMLTITYPISKAMIAPGYKALLHYNRGEIYLETAKAMFVQNDMNLAKRQMTWFKRNKSIHWINHPKQVVDLITTFLNKNP